MDRIWEDAVVTYLKVPFQSAGTYNNLGTAGIWDPI
jgi:hypothetical protein